MSLCGKNSSGNGWRLIFLFLLFLSCSPEKPKKEVSSFSGVAMTIPYRILVGYQLSEKRKECVQHVIDSTFSEVNNTFNKYNPQSELSRLNRLDAYESIPISMELSEVLQETSKMVAISDGRFDPTVEPAVHLWQEHLCMGAKPTEESIALVSRAVGWQHVHQKQNMFWKEYSQTSMDLGGIAKGLCVDMLVERLNNAGFFDVFVEWGGEIRASGRHPEGRPWTVFISRLNDIDPNHAIDFVGLENQAIATSGDYHQQWTVGGITYSHILNPKNCRPIVVKPHSIASATVIAPTCTMADALATAAMLFSNAEDAKKWAEEVKSRHPEVSFWIITRD